MTDLSDMSRKTLDALFEQATPIHLDSLNGNYAGKAYGIPGIDKLPRLLRRFLIQLINLPWVNVFWKGKSFHQGEGSNLWFSCSGRYCYGHYHYAVSQQSAFTLNYDVTNNLRPIRSLYAEVRLLPEDDKCRELYLGKVIIKGKRLMYFTLQPISTEQS